MTTATRQWLVAAAAGMGLATVVLAAAGAHAVRLTDEQSLRLWQTATAMLGFHALALLGIAALAAAGSTGSLTGRSMAWLRAAAGAMLAGTLVFSVTLLLRAGGSAALPAVAPIGGLLMMAGWCCLAVAAFTRR